MTTRLVTGLPMLVDDVTGAFVGVRGENNIDNEVAHFLRDSIGNVTGVKSSNSTINFPRVLAQSAVPVILAPSGTVATDGTLTLGTALPLTYSGGAWVRLPANAVVGGAAGLYWTVFSSTTVGAVKTLFADPSTAFTPYVPTVALVAATGSNAAYTQTTGADITLANITVPAGSMGMNGSVKVMTLWNYTNSANSKILKVKFGGTSYFSTSATTTASGKDFREIQNRGVANSQIAGTSSATSGGIGLTTAALVTSAVDTAADVALIVTGQLATTATEYLVLECVASEVTPL